MKLRENTTTDTENSLFQHTFSKLKDGVCPCCSNPIQKTDHIDCHLYANPCGCQIDWRPIESVKIVRMDELRAAKNAYQGIKDEQPQFGMSFQVFFPFMKARKTFLIRSRMKAIEK